MEKASLRQECWVWPWQCSKYSTKVQLLGQTLVTIGWTLFWSSIICILCTLISTRYSLFCYNTYCISMFHIHEKYQQKDVHAYLLLRSLVGGAPTTGLSGEARAFSRGTIKNLQRRLLCSKVSWIPNVNTHGYLKTRMCIQKRFKSIVLAFLDRL